MKRYFRLLRNYRKSSCCMILLLLLSGLMFTGCSEHKSVNLLISNPTNGTLKDQQVGVPLNELHEYLLFDEATQLLLLNEKNEPVNFRIQPEKQRLEFVVPLVMPRAQKQFTLCTEMPSLWSNLFAFRRRSIPVNVKD